MNTQTLPFYLRALSTLTLAFLFHFSLLISTTFAAAWQEEPSAEAESAGTFPLFMLIKFGLPLIFVLAMLAHLFGIIRLPWMASNTTVTPSAD